MHARMVRVTDQAEACLVSQEYATQNRSTPQWSSDALERGIVDLYAHRIRAVSAQHAETRQDALDRIVVTQPFGRPFTAQPSFPPDPIEQLPGGLAGLRRKLAAAATPARKLATS
jgi:hypothetical protein